jgi:hypothetical protein
MAWGSESSKSAPGTEVNKADDAWGSESSKPAPATEVNKADGGTVVTTSLIEDPSGSTTDVTLDPLGGGPLVTCLLPTAFCTLPGNCHHAGLSLSPLLGAAPVGVDGWTPSDGPNKLRCGLETCFPEIVCLCGQLLGRHLCTGGGCV